MGDKTLGQVAYETWRLWDEWEDLPPDHQAAWQAAAEAVRDEVVSRAAINEQMYYSSMSPIRDEEREVIEAAKVWCANHTNITYDESGFALHEAVEALLEVEGQ